MLRIYFQTDLLRLTSNLFTFHFTTLTYSLCKVISRTAGVFHQFPTLHSSFKHSSCHIVFYRKIWNDVFVYNISKLTLAQQNWTHLFMTQLWAYRSPRRHLSNVHLTDDDNDDDDWYSHSVHVNSWFYNKFYIYLSNVSMKISNSITFPLLMLSSPRDWLLWCWKFCFLSFHC